MLQHFLSYLDGAERRFNKYFKENYCNRLGQWASYFRTGAIVNTNMFVESFHRTLKVVYLQQKHNRRIDFLLHTLLKIARDKVFEHLTKFEKGKYSHRVSEINKRHKAAMNMLPLRKYVTDVNKSAWSAPSARDSSIKYTVHLLQETCDCRLRCSTCGVCVHMYTCSCIDSTLHATVCKHIHFLKILAMETSGTRSTNSTVEYFSNLLDKGNNIGETELSTLCPQILTKINELTVLVRTCKNVDALKTSSKHLTSAIMAIKAMQGTADTQCTLPKKKKKLGVQGMRKPTHEEMEASRHTLISQATTICGICLAEDDRDSTEFIVMLQFVGTQKVRWCRTV